MEKKRTGPEPVTPVTYKGVRYEAVHWGKSRDLDQNGGYVAAIDDNTGEELWIVKVYDVDYDNDMDPDKQDVFISKLKLRRFRKLLSVKDERGGLYFVDLTNRAVIPA